MIFMGFLLDAGKKILCCGLVFKVWRLFLFLSFWKPPDIDTTWKPIYFSPASSFYHLSKSDEIAGEEKKRFVKRWNPNNYLQASRDLGFHNRFSLSLPTKVYYYVSPKVISNHWETRRDQTFVSFFLLFGSFLSFTLSFPLVGLLLHHLMSSNNKSYQKKPEKDKERKIH